MNFNFVLEYSLPAVGICCLGPGFGSLSLYLSIWLSLTLALTGWPGLVATHCQVNLSEYKKKLFELTFGVSSSRCLICLELF